MGLDMYLSAKRYLWNISDDDKALAEKIDNVVGGASLGKTNEVRKEAFYWRKAWAIHHWFVINAMDFGWDHPQAHIQMWIDPDEDVIYIARGIKQAKKQPYEIWERVKVWAEGVPTAWPHDGLQTEKGSAKQQKSYYEDAGWEMLDQHATWPMGGNGVEQGIVEIYNRINLGKFRIFDHLTDVFDEFLQYHRDEKGNIVKVNDDLLSAIRYAYMMRRHAIHKYDVGAQDDYYEESQGNEGRWL